jgi:hypothetical protein
MADVVLPVVGATVGFVVGGPSGAVMGANIGMMAASTFFPTTQRVQLPMQEGPRLADLRAQTATYGNMIPKVYGTMRLAGKRQHTTSTERMKKHRSKKKTDVTRSDAKKRDVTACDAALRKNAKISPDTDETTDTDLEEKAETDSDLKIDSDKKSDEREEKRESEREKHCSDTLRQMADIWDTEVQSKITPDQKTILTAKRKELLNLRWVDEFAEDIRAWRYFCEIIGASDFCLGRLEGKDWTIDLTWAIQSADRVAKILEGGFSGGKHPSKPSSCQLPEFQDAWDEVLGRMAHHHGKPAIRSWFANTRITDAEQTADGALLTLTCPSEFIRGWIETHYLTDVNHCWSEQTRRSQPVLGVQLITQEANHG